MRIITGEARGVKLESPPDQETRPTLERVKEGLFSALQFDIPGSRVLDLFGGSGQLGLECASRGAAHVTINDSSRDMAALIKRNAQKCRLMEKCTVLQSDWKETLRSAARSKNRFDIVFLDPPFNAGILAEALAMLDSLGLVEPNGTIACECSQSELPLALPAGLEEYRSYKYSRTVVTLFRPAAGEPQ